MANIYITRFKFYLLALLPVFLTTLVSATNIIFPPGNASIGDDRRPYGVFFGHERTQMVYEEAATELNLPGGSIISDISFWFENANNPPNLSFPVKIYMREVASPTVTSSTVASIESASNLVYSGDMTPADWAPLTGHWVTRTLNGAPLVLTGGLNLEILVETDWQFYNTCCGFWPQPGNPNNVNFAQNTKANSTQQWNQDMTAPIGNGLVQSTRPNIMLNYVLATPCAGPPSGVTALASANPTCAIPFNLTITGIPPVSGLTYQWFSSTGGPFTPIAGATAPFYTITQSQTTSYYCQITCSGISSNSSTVTVTQNPATNCYCASSATQTGDTDIGEVTFGSLDNVPGGNVPVQNNGSAVNLYTNYTSTVAPPNLMQGITYGNVAVSQITTTGCFYPAYSNIFIDYNQDGTFDPVSERVFSMGSTNNGNVLCSAGVNPSTLTGSVTIPFSALPGLTRMRVMLVELDAGGAANNPPCGTYLWGETEDYNVNIQPGTPCINPQNPGSAASSLTNVCATQTFVLSISGNTTLGSGQTWQWQSASAGVGGPYSNIAGATMPFYSTTQPSSPAIVWYRCVLICSAGAPALTAPVQVNSNPVTLCYCNTGLHSVDCSAYYISNVTLNTLNNTTGCSSGNALAYTVYPSSGSTTTPIVQNNTYIISVTTGGSPQTISVWIDWNGNGAFETTEWYGLTGNPPVAQAPGTYTIPVTVPASSVTGLTGMRVRSRITTPNGPPDACLQFGSGETEDYLITINPFVPPTCTSASNVSSSAVSNNMTPCSGQQINLSLLPNLAVTYSGLSYQWQIDTNNIWTNIAGATNPTLSTSVTYRYANFRCVVTCISCCGPVNSAPVTINNSPTTWLGFDNDWSSGTNWCGRVPTAVDSVQISFINSGRPAASYKAPIVSSGAALAAFNLKIDNTDSLTVLTDSLVGGFNVAQHIVNDGKINISSTTGDTLPLGPVGAGLSNFTPFRNVTDNLSQFIYTFSEVNAGGTRLRRNDVIDSLFFIIKSRTSTHAYENFSISYGFTSQTQYTTATPITGLTQIYSNASLPVFTMVPGASGILKLPVTGFQWTDTTQNIVLQICYHSTTGAPGGTTDMLYYTATSGKTYLQLVYNVLNGGPNGCALTTAIGGVSTFFTPTANRPNITFRYHRPQRPLTGTIGSSTTVGGGYKNNGSGSALYLSNANFTITGTVNNDGAIKLDSSNLTINASNAAWPITDFLNNSLTDLTYSPLGYLRKSQIFFNGNTWATGGSFIPGTLSNVVFGGSQAQFIGTANPITFNDLKMKKSAVTQTVTLNKPITVNNILTLDTGRVMMNKNSITINNSAPSAITKVIAAGINSVLISDDTLSKVNWNIGATGGAHLIPFADVLPLPPAGGHYIPFTFTVPGVGGGDVGMATVATYATGANNQPYPPGPATDPDPLNNTLGTNDSALAVNRYWIISKSSVLGASTGLTFNFSDVERTSSSSIGASTNPATGMTAANPGKAQPWGQAGGWRLPPVGQAYSFTTPFLAPAMPGYSAARINTVSVTYTWNFGNSNSWAIAANSTTTPLPIHLLSFNAKADEDKTRINWVTASEENNDYFTVERTMDFNEHTEIARVTSQGNSNDLQYYEAWDNHPKTGINYYRLLQTDRGGLAQQASDYVAVRFGVKSTFDILYITNESEVQVTFDYNSSENVNYTVTDMVGKTIASGANIAAEPGLNILKLDASAWPHGMYLITLQNSEKTVTHKLVY